MLSEPLFPRKRRQAWLSKPALSMDRLRIGEDHSPNPLRSCVFTQPRWEADVAESSSAPYCYKPSMTEPALDASGKATLAAQAWVEVCELLDLQLSPLGMHAALLHGPVQWRPGLARRGVGQSSFL